jgi:hypothetical protein
MRSSALAVLCGVQNYADLFFRLAYSSCQLTVFDAA